jgi:hypothetical protein
VKIITGNLQAIRDESIAIHCMTLQPCIASEPNIVLNDESQFRLTVCAHLQVFRARLLQYNFHWIPIELPGNIARY